MNRPPARRALLLAGLAVLIALPAWFLFDRTRSSDPARPSAAFTPTPAAAPCVWTWFTQPLPELTAQAAAALEGHPALVGYRVDVRAFAFGENCLGEDATVRYFAAMQTDFDVTLATHDQRLVEDDETAGEILRAVLEILAGFPPDSTPGPNPGRITVEFILEDGQTGLARRLQVGYQAAMTALVDGLTGAALIEASGGWLP